MTAAERRAASEAAATALAARWRAHRCHCGAAARSVFPGTAAIRSNNGMLLVRAKRTRFYCLDHTPGLIGPTKLRNERSA